MVLHAKSTFLSLITNQRLRHIFTPWHIIVDFKEQNITLRKSNWFLISVDEKTSSFRYIRDIEIDKHLFGADIKIKLSGSYIEASSISKKSAKRIKDQLAEYNNKIGKRHVVMN
jgi:hypothetical protein